MQEHVKITEEESRNIVSENKSQKERINELLDKITKGT